MGNYRFKLSDMIPNAWFYKLRDMSKTKAKTTTKHYQKSSPSSHYSSSTTTKPLHQNHHFSQPRNSFYYTPKISQFHNSPKFPHFHDPQTKKPKPKPNRKTIYKPSPKHTISTCLTESTHTLQDFIRSPTTNTSPSSESTQSGHATASWCTTCRLSSSNSDIIIDLNKSKKFDNLSYGYDYISQETDIKLTPIITKQVKPISRNKQTSHSGKKVNQTPARKSVSGGVKLKVNSPKLAISKRISQRKHLTESFAIIKTSFDPQQDFMESMMEMIVENNMSKSSKDLEDLLACYLSLNSHEYHGVIVKAFEEIWFSLPDI